MNEQSRELEALLSRVGRLERENRWFKRGVLALLAVIVSVGLMAQTKQTAAGSQKQRARTPAKPAAKPAEPPAPGPVVATTVEAQEFVLKDGNGHVRAELAMMGSTPSLKFKDESGSALITLALNSDAPGGPLLLMSDPQHHASVALSVLENAGPQFSLAGERPDIQVRMGVTPDGTSLDLSDKDGFMTSIGNGVLPKNGQVKKTSAASIVLFGKDRKVLWSAP